MYDTKINNKKERKIKKNEQKSLIKWKLISIFLYYNISNSLIQLVEYPHSWTTNKWKVFESVENAEIHTKERPSKNSSTYNWWYFLEIIQLIGSLVQKLEASVQFEWMRTCSNKVQTNWVYRKKFIWNQSLKKRRKQNRSHCSLFWRTWCQLNSQLKLRNALHNTSKNSSYDTNINGTIIYLSFSYNITFYII